MAQYHRVLWSEGLFLTQHHFQQFDQFHEQDRFFQVRALSTFAWGANHLAIDVEAVNNRLFTLTEFEGVLPDGTTVRAPSVDDPPPSRSFDALFAPTEKTLSVYLALPKMRPGIPGVRMEAQEAHTPTRYIQAFATVTDQVTGEHEREIPFVKKRLMILFSGEELEGFDTLKIAEIERNAEGVAQLRESFVPPLLSVSASNWLTNQLRGILETASAKSQTLADQVRQRTPLLTEFSTSDLPNFLKLHTINAYIPTLVHMYNYPRVHPAALFEHLARFAGHLCSFKVGEHPRDLPIYRHEEAGKSFVALTVKLRELLEAAVESRFVKIPLRRLDQARFEGDISDRALFDNSDFYLGVSASLSESRVAGEFPKHAKVISPELLPRLVEKAVPGAVLIFVQLPPAAIPRKAGMVYFRIDPRGDRWEYIKRASQIAIHVPPQDFPDLDIECLAVER
ncbi:MAG: type VI secretion system baseplate subunit TssK [Candidatus Zixiibacteriota bacterium]